MSLLWMCLSESILVLPHFAHTSLQIFLPTRSILGNKGHLKELPRCRSNLAGVMPIYSMLFSWVDT
jgi:hypothetical protein